MNSENLQLILWCASSIAAIGVGLTALGLHTLKILHLNQLRTFFEYVCGMLGLYLLVMFVFYRDSGGSLSNPWGQSAWLALALINLSLGLSGLGTNILKALKIDDLRKLLAIISGATGIYGLVVALS